MTPVPRVTGAVLSRAAAAGAGTGVLTAMVLLFLVLALLGSGDAGTVAALLLVVVLLAALAGGAVGAWQAAAAGAPSRGAAIVAGALGPALVGVLSAVTVAAADPPVGAGALSREILVILTGSLGGAWLLARRLEE